MFPQGARGPEDDSPASAGPDDIMSFARVWTGFDQQEPRGNIEKPLISYFLGTGSNKLDPLRIRASGQAFGKGGMFKNVWHDPFPKMGDNSARLEHLFLHMIVLQSADWVSGAHPVGRSV